MNETINFDLRSINAFINISDSGIKSIQKEAKLLKFPLGYPLCTPDVIPNQIFILLRGEARAFICKDNKFTTISKIKEQEFVGLSSFLRAEACENVAAVDELIVLALADKLIIKLYQEEISFKTWCDTNTHITEISSLENFIFEESTKKINYDLKTSIDLLSKNLNLKVKYDGESIESNNDYINIIGSANVIDKKIGDLLESSEVIKTRGPFPARIFEINKSIYEVTTKIKNINKKSKLELEIDDTSKIDTGESALKSDEKIGQYNPNKAFKVIKATGDLRESLACLQMLAREFDLPYRVDSIEKILRDTIKKGKKPSIQLMASISSMMGLHSTIAKVPCTRANRLPHPSLICWGNSFAVVKESNASGLEIASPNDGIVFIQTEDFEETFDNSIELVLVEKHEQSPEIKFGLQWLLPVINRYRNILFQVLISSFVVQLLGLANPLMIQVIIDKVISQRSLDTLQILGFALVVVTIFGGILSSLRTFLFQETTNRIDTRLGAEVIDHLLRLPLKYFDSRPVGELGSRVAELEKIRNFLTGQALTTILDAIFSLIYIVVMVVYSWLLTLIALGVVPIQILLTLLGTPLIRRQVREIAQENASTQSHLVEVLTGIQTVKAQNVERVSRWKWQELYSKYIAKSFQKTITGTALSETSQVLQKLSQLLVLWIGASLVLQGQLSLGQLIAFRIISGYVTQPLLRLSTIWQNIQELRVSFERLADIIDTPEEAPETEQGKIPLPNIEGKVVFEDLSFSFNRGEAEVLKKINLEIKPGQFVGIVGQSGSGKSTLMKLLPRLYNPNSGRVLIDGYDVDKVELYSLRRQIGIVPQEPLLFAGTINDNIALTEPDAPSDEIVNASEISNAHEFIMSLKDGYNTNIGERGAGLSGGQKQRIAIARTLLSKPKLLIMDEATSALDYETERKVCEGLRKCCKNSTVFFITHRLSTVRNSDLIVMLHKGSIAEIGTHMQLMESKGRYFALYRQQESS